MYMVWHNQECIQIDTRKMNRYFTIYLKCNIPDFRPDFDVVKEGMILKNIKHLQTQIVGIPNLVSGFGQECEI